MLDVGPARLAHGRHVKTVTFRNEGRFPRAQPVVMGLALFQAGIAAAAAASLLRFLHRRCESDLCKFVAHDALPSVRHQCKSVPINEIIAIECNILFH